MKSSRRLKHILFPLLLFLFSYGYGQKNSSKDSRLPQKEGSIRITAETSPIDLARGAYLAQGGQKFRDLQTLVLSGTVDVYIPNSTQATPSTFVYISARERLRKEVTSATSFVRQIHDGQHSYFSLRGIGVPPPGKFGLFILTKYDQPGYSVTALPDKDKARAFRITDAEGNATDFYIDPETAQVKRQVVVYNHLTYGTEYKKWKSVDGLLVPDSYTEGIESPQGTFYGEYKVKEVKINQPVSDDMFAIPSATKPAKQ
jgi:hypothetical protein